MFAVFNTLGFVVPAAALRTHTHTTVVRHRSPTDPSVIILDSTTTTTVTQEDWDEYERQFHARETAGVDEFAMAGAGFELDVYTRGAFGHALGDARGYHVALTMPVLNKPGIMIETGFYRDQILTIDSSTQRAWHAIAGGPTVRMHVPALRVATFNLGVDLNWRAMNVEQDDTDMRTIDSEQYAVRYIARQTINLGARLYLWRLSLGADAQIARIRDFAAGGKFTLGFGF